MTSTARGPGTLQAEKKEGISVMRGGAMETPEDPGFRGKAIRARADRYLVRISLLLLVRRRR